MSKIIYFKEKEIELEDLITYDDWQIGYDRENDKYYATDENGTYECELIKVSNDKEHTDEELLKGSFIGEPFDFGGECDGPIQIDLGVIDGVHKFDYIYQYGYFKKVEK